MNQTKCSPDGHLGDLDTAHILRDLGIMVIVLGQMRRIMYLNDAAKKIVGDVRGREWEDIIPKSDHLNMWEKLAALGLEERNITYVGRVICDGGHVRTVIWSLTKTRIDGSAVVVAGFLPTKVDDKAALAQLVPALRGELASAMNDSLTGILGELLRSLSLVMLLAGLLGEALVDTPYKRDARRLLQATKRLRRIMQELDDTLNAIGAE